MKKILKAVLSAAIMLLASAALTITACAEDYVFEIPEPTQSGGNWDPAFVYETANAQNFPDNFNALWMTPDSDIVVEYSYEGKAAKAPLELIWQTWNGPVEPNPDVKKNWNKVAPYEYSETSAKFSFEDIAAAYGTEDFSAVYAINIIDRGVLLTITKITVTNCSINGSAETETVTETTVSEETEALTEATSQTEAVTVSETQPPETTAQHETEKETAVNAAAPVTEAVSEAKPEENSGGAGTVIIVMIVFIIIAGIAAAVYISKKKKKKSRYY